MIQPDLIIFDCDGVLVDSEVLSCRCLSKILAGYGIDLGLDQALDLFLGRSVSAVCRPGFAPHSLPRFARLKA